MILDFLCELGIVLACQVTRSPSQRDRQAWTYPTQTRMLWFQRLPLLRMDQGSWAGFLWITLQRHDGRSVHLGKWDGPMEPHQNQKRKQQRQKWQRQTQLHLLGDIRATHCIMRQVLIRDHASLSPGASGAFETFLRQHPHGDWSFIAEPQKVAIKGSFDVRLHGNRTLRAGCHRVV